MVNSEHKACLFTGFNMISNLKMHDFLWQNSYKLKLIHDTFKQSAQMFKFKGNMIVIILNLLFFCQIFLQVFSPKQRNLFS